MRWMLLRQTQRVDAEVILRQFTHLHHQPTVCKGNGKNSLVSFFLFLFILIYMCVELLCSCASNNNNVSSWSSQVGVSVYYIWTRFVRILFLLFVFSNKEPIDVSAASSSELNTRVKGRKCGSRSENVTSSTIIYMGQVFSLFVFLLFVVP